MLQHANSLFVTKGVELVFAVNSYHSFSKSCHSFWWALYPETWSGLEGLTSFSDWLKQHIKTMNMHFILKVKALERGGSANSLEYNFKIKLKSGEMHQGCQSRHYTLWRWQFKLIEISFRGYFTSRGIFHVKQGEIKLWLFEVAIQFLCCMLYVFMPTALISKHLVRMAREKNLPLKAEMLSKTSSRWAACAF